jgi:hypothetical protein
MARGSCTESARDVCGVGARLASSLAAVAAVLTVT